MSEHHLIEAHLAQLRSRLRGSDAAKDETIDELRDHLLEASAGLEARGVDTADADLVAVARLGSASQLADDLTPERHRGVGRRAARIAAVGSLIAAAVPAAAVIAHPMGNDRGLAERLQAATAHVGGTQEPSGQEVNGVPVPQSSSGDFAGELAARMAILD